MKLVAVDGKERVQVTVGAAHRLLVVAVLATAVEDIVAGREEVGWLEGAMCRHWCEWLDLEPGAVRRAVEGQLAGGERRKGDLSWEQMAWALEAHHDGMSWSQLAARLGMSQKTLRGAMQRSGYGDG